MYLLSYSVMYQVSKILLKELWHVSTSGGVGSLVTKSCPTLVTPRGVSCRLFCPWGFSRQEYWSGLPFPSPGDPPWRLLNPGNWTRVSCIAGRFFSDWAMREGKKYKYEPKNKYKSNPTWFHHLSINSIDYIIYW